ncbi:unnamed protein product [Kuraishia capsulata CBS 1993]|uniref:STB6-like N-terminal domain-containing protein n=1 Tax=Kuraishia capsulata CBS 1993 TaxID=1382522 RepID=W6MXS0_9ASCO|nr:uncharacterized protein KUCA_T00005363001 [Kuraishia capsulata CBS 1993]CDK29375.1 unnamed protein product [Kuraishia capsulata CBS 1993]
MSLDTAQVPDSGVDYLTTNYPSAISRTSSLPSSTSGSTNLRHLSFSGSAAGAGKEFLQSFILPDLKAVDFLRCEFPPGLAVFDRVVLSGYEIYIVEQWALDRKVGTVITTYTGDPNDEVSAYAVVLTRDESEWPLSFRSYLSELLDSAYARLNNTDSGSIFITNLGQLTDLSLIPVPNGNIDEVWELFLVNENLKRFGCGSRSALMLASPSKAAEDKFRQMFRVHSSVAINYASVELVMILQVFLYYFDLLNPIYGDGLLCNKTVDAIDAWRNLYGSRYLKPSFKRTDCLSPATVAGIIGMVLVIRARLDEVGNNVVAPKDPLNTEKFRLAVGQFQRYANRLYSSMPVYTAPSLGLVTSPGHERDALPVVLKLNAATIDRLVEATLPKNQTLKNDLLKVKRMFKNTVSDLSSGKTLQTLNIASPVIGSAEGGQLGLTFDEDCLDLDYVLQYIHGKRMMYLWKGKGSAVDLDSVRVSSLTLKEISKTVHVRARADVTTSPDNSELFHNNMMPTMSSLVDAGDRLQHALRSESMTNGTKPSGLLPNGMVSKKNGSRSRSDSVQITKQKSNTIIDRGSFTDLSTNGDYPSSYNGPVGQIGLKAARQEGVDAAFYSRLNRRFSFPLAPEDLSLPTIGNRDYAKDETNLSGTPFFTPRNELSSYTVPATSRASKLRRSKSFSLVEGALLTWQYPFLPSPEWLAKRYLVVKAEYEDEFLRSDYQFRETWKRIQACTRSTIANNPLKQVSLNHVVSSKHLEDMRESVRTSQHLLEAKAADIELLNSRLKYELRLLTLKVKDVEQNLMQLRNFKMKDLIESMRYYEAKYMGPEAMELQVPLETRVKSVGSDDNPVTAFLLYIYAYILCAIGNIWFRIVPKVNANKIKSRWEKVDPNGRLAEYFAKLNQRVSKAGASTYVACPAVLPRGTGEDCSLVLEEVQENGKHGKEEAEQESDRKHAL